MGWLWPESNSRKARWSLNSSIYTLRKVLKSALPAGTATNVIVQDHGHYFLDPDISLWVDKDEFERHVVVARHYENEQRNAEAMANYEAAISLYRGDYLFEDLYEDWTMIERERLSRIYLSALGSLAHYYTRSQHYHESIQLCYSLLQKDRCNERAWALLEESYEGLGLRKQLTSVQNVSQYTAMSIPSSAKYQI
jgi:two-component SAPR family response regulator